jgi:hypothetical protein
MPQRELELEPDGDRATGAVPDFKLKPIGERVGLGSG